MRLTNALRNIPHLSHMRSLSGERACKVYLVGGYLRDIVLNKKKAFFDFDFCVEKHAAEFSKLFSKRVKGTFIVLDPKQKSYRVITKKKKCIYTYDFTQMRGASLEKDVLLRDFTINTLALEIKDSKKRLIDTQGALRDLKAKRIRSLGSNTLIDDPLRILRAYTFSGKLGFTIEKKTENLLKRHRRLLKNVSGERINEELFKIFALENSFSIIKKMSADRVIDETIPYITVQRKVHQGRYHHLDVWDHSLEALYRLEQLYKRKFKKREGMRVYCERIVANKHTLYQLLKLACLLHDAGKPFAKKKKANKTIFHTHEKIGRDLIDTVYEKLKLSSKEKEVLKKLIFWHLRPGYLADQIYPSMRAVYRFFRDTEDLGVGVIILSLADWRATRGELVDTKKRLRHERVMFRLIDFYFKESRKKPLPKLVDGNDIMRTFKIAPSPLIGKVLRTIKEEQALGKVTSKKQALVLTRRVIKMYQKPRRR